MNTTMIAMTISLATLFSALAYGADKANGTTDKFSPKFDYVQVATCNDGKVYFAPTNDHRFACGGHKGVKSWFDGSPVRAKRTGAAKRVYK